MDRAVISNRINRILGDLQKLSNTLCAMENMDIFQYPENYAMLATDAALLSERIACRLRRLLYGSTGIRKETYLSSAGDAQGITIQNEGGVLQITLPCLLPKRKQRHSTEYLTDPMYFALSRYADGHMLPMYKHCVVCFCHIYSKELPTNRVRDYDNLEMKQLLDVLATFIMEDDNGLLVDAYNTTELGEKDCTCICVMDRLRFTRWLEERQDRMENISDF